MHKRSTSIFNKTYSVGMCGSASVETNTIFLELYLQLFEFFLLSVDNDAPSDILLSANIQSQI